MLSIEPKEITMETYGIDSHTCLYESDLDYALQCAKIDEAYKQCPPDRVLIGYVEDYDGNMTLVTNVNFEEYQHDDRTVWL